MTGPETVLSVETEVYNNLRDSLEREHRLEWIVIYKTEVVGFYEDFQLAAVAAIEKHGRGPYLIKQIGAPEMPLNLSLFNKPMYA